MILSQSDFARRWLEQFPAQDRLVAAQLADALMLISHDELYRGLRRLVDDILLGRKSTDFSRPISLFAEREVELEPQGSKVSPFYPNMAKGRATGLGVPPVSVEPGDQEVGSEGAIANFITSYERLNRGRVLNHPGPDSLRQERASHIVIVTDFIGSGERVWEMIEAFWRVASIRSWHSYRRIQFSAVAYSGTEPGLDRVRSHKSKPEVKVVHACPTISTAFTGAKRQAIEKLCRTYPGGTKMPFGYGYAGALIAFSHGMPDNVPPVLYSSANGWLPLFVNRSALAADLHFPEANADQLAERAREVLRIKTAEKFLSDPANRRWIETMLVLTAIRDGAKTPPNVSARTRLPISKVDEILVQTRVAHWTSSRNALTMLGRRELRRLQLRRARVVVLPTPEQPYYYPTQLRAR